MKYKLETLSTLYKEGRWDIDYHLPAEGIKVFDPSILKPISYAAKIVKEKRDPTKNPNEEFIYVDISSVDVSTGEILTPQNLIGSEAPSRARKVINAYDIVISTCRPTRGAIAVVPEKYNKEVCSTGFSIIRPKKGVNPYYLHFAIRLHSTLEQFRKFSTGSSYPAILDGDVKKTLIPLPNKETQDLIAAHILEGLHQRNTTIEKANEQFKYNIEAVIKALSQKKYDNLKSEFDGFLFKSDDILKRRNKLNDSDFKLKS